MGSIRGWGDGDVTRALAFLGALWLAIELERNRRFWAKARLW